MNIVLSEFLTEKILVDCLFFFNSCNKIDTWQHIFCNYFYHPWKNHGVHFLTGKMFFTLVFPPPPTSHLKPLYQVLQCYYISEKSSFIKFMCRVWSLNLVMITVMECRTRKEVKTEWEDYNFITDFAISWMTRTSYNSFLRMVSLILWISVRTWFWFHLSFMVCSEQHCSTLGKLFLPDSN